MRPSQTQGGRSDAAGSRSSRIRRARGDKGVALVEFAIVLPVLMCVLLGMLTGGAALAKKIDMTDAIREGARFGATIQVGTTDADLTNAALLTAWSNKVKSRIVELSGGRLATTDLCVALVQSTGSAAQTAANCFVADPTSSTGDYVVRVRGTGNAKLEAFFFSTNIPLDVKVAARYERD
jgi:Flp pilus assembly protein TadG